MQKILSDNSEGVKGEKHFVWQLASEEFPTPGDPKSLDDFNIRKKDTGISIINIWEYRHDHIETEGDRGEIIPYSNVEWAKEVPNYQSLKQENERLKDIVSVLLNIFKSHEGAINLTDAEWRFVEKAKSVNP